ncbi:glycosyltransferase family 2 protein [Ochrobactrum sp. BTU1]|uniref:glycosyltransferase family 2 protein n=1 Tax=Ochrobactrum sp. BTU1 TaxID=2840456 RepID=UPI001C05AC78|nr:glycosyltransferase family 2 protein [Ochrobactrum sp. BTU1]
MKIIGILLQRDEIDVVLFNVLYHLNVVGLDRLIVGDNGSTDGSREALHKLERVDPRLIVIDMPGEFEQALRVNELYQLAISLGADWILPLDADEFLPMKRSKLANVLRETDSLAVEMEINNFVQRRGALHKRLRNLASMLYRAPILGSKSEAMALVNSGEVGFVEAAYPPKFLWRANKQLSLLKGNHGADICLGNVPICIPLYHAPLRSKASIFSRVASIARLESGTPDTAWHIKRLIDVNVEEEWRRNSYKRGQVGTNAEKHRLEFDPFFLRVFLRYYLKVIRLVRQN